MTKYIYGFVCDEALQRWKNSKGYNTALLVSYLNQGAGVATQNVIEYFNDVAVIKDTRSSRFPNLTGESSTFYGDLAFIIDMLPPNSEGGLGTTDGGSAFPSDTLDLDSIPPEKWDKVFNIIEDCMYYRGSASSTIVNTLNTRFRNSTTYAGYISSSVGMSSNTVTSNADFMTGIEARTSNDSVIDSSILDLPYWFEFSFNFNIEGHEDEEVHFKLWVSEESFLEQYPLITITDVILPADPEKLTSPSKFIESGLDARELVIDSIFESSDSINAAYKNNFMHKDTNDQTVYTESSGVFVHKTRYYPSIYSSPHEKMAGFALIYKGPTPSIELSKKAICAKLLEISSETDIPESVWRLAFPDVYSNAIFYLIPMWNNLITVLHGDDPVEVESGITKLSNILSFVKNIFADYTENDLRLRTELLLNDATNLIIAVVPDKANDANKTMKLMYPSYLPFDGTTGEFYYQSADTQAVNRLISNAIGCANKGIIGPEPVYSGLSYSYRETIPGTTLKFIMFTYGAADFYLLDKSQASLIVNNGE